MTEWIIIVILVAILVIQWVLGFYVEYYLGKISFKESNYISYEVGKKYYFHVLVKRDKTYTTEKIEVNEDCYDAFEIGDKFGVKL